MSTALGPVFACWSVLSPPPQAPVTSTSATRTPITRTRRQVKLVVIDRRLPVVVVVARLVVVANAARQAPRPTVPGWPLGVRSLPAGERAQVGGEEAASQAQLSLAQSQLLGAKYGVHQLRHQRALVLGEGHLALSEPDLQRKLTQPSPATFRGMPGVTDFTSPIPACPSAILVANLPRKNVA